MSREDRLRRLERELAPHGEPQRDYMTEHAEYILEAAAERPAPIALVEAAEDHLAADASQRPETASRLQAVMFDPEVMHKAVDFFAGGLWDPSGLPRAHN